MNKIRIKIISLFVILLMTSTLVNAAEITASVDRNPIPVGESFQFVLTAIGDIDKSPDFSELQAQFTILNTSKSSSYSFSNIGGSQSKKTWIMQLLIDEPGKYTIPAINFGKDKSDSVNIIVMSNTSKINKAEHAEIYFEIEVEPKTAYVQQQVIYTVKVFRRVNIAANGFSTLATENNQAVITKLGKVSEKNVVINGISHIESIYKFAVFPQKSGTLRILPLIYEAQIIQNRGQQSFFSPLNQQTKTYRIKSKAFDIIVKGIPIEFSDKYPTAAWLPVDNLTMTESWSGDINSFKTGEPMTQTISLTAQNLSAAQLPDVKVTSIKNIKTYPDVPVVTEQSNNKGLVANKQFKTALLPTKVGKLTLPKIIVPWWNTQTDKIQEAIIKTKTITVSSAISQGEEQQIKIKDDTVSQDINPEVTSDEVDLNINPIKITKSNNQASSLWIIACIIFAVLWLITIYLLLSLRKKFNAVTVTTEDNNFTRVVSSKELKSACVDNNAAACSQLLIQWANSKTDTDRFTNLSSLLPYAQQELSDAIIALEKCRYSNRSEKWSGTKLWSAFESTPPDFNSEKQQKFTMTSLPSLYAKYK